MDWPEGSTRYFFIRVKKSFSFYSNMRIERFCETGSTEQELGTHLDHFSTHPPVQHPKHSTPKHWSAEPSNSCRSNYPYYAHWNWVERNPRADQVGVVIDQNSTTSRCASTSSDRGDKVVVSPRAAKGKIFVPSKRGGKGGSGSGRGIDSRGLG